METRNPIYTSQATIDCEINHPSYGWIPFTASPNDVEPLGRELFANLEHSAEPFIAPPTPDPAEVLAAETRAKRDNLLTASDWTQVADAPVDQAAWAIYRQALRDIPAQEGFPASVVWPTPPE
jgi:hypothetical protein